MERQSVEAFVVQGAILISRVRSCSGGDKRGAGRRGGRALGVGGGGWATI